MEEFIEGQIWLKSYPVHYSGTHFDARMSIIALGDGGLALHSPCNIHAINKAAVGPRVPLSV